MTFVDLLGPSCALFLDFDGTLVDIAPLPEAVVVPQTLVSTLEALHQQLGGAVAVISGRPIDQIDRFLAPLRLPVAGVHGVERRGPDGVITLLDFHPLQHVEDAAAAMVREHPQLRAEYKRGSVALHFRQAPELGPACVQAFQAAVDRSPGLGLLHGKMVVEAKPGGASKGSAIAAFLAEAPFKGRRPVFIGDDVTDEAGFATVQRLGGVGIKVGTGPTGAQRRLATPAEMRELLQALVETRTAGAGA